MRPAVEFTASLAPPPAAAGNSARHSPASFLFGALAAMLGLIAAALLVLACSYRRRYPDSAADMEITARIAKAAGVTDVKPPTCYEQSVVVIMAGDAEPTFIATPISGGAPSFTDSVGSCSDGGPKGSEGDGVGKKANSFSIKDRGAE